MLVPLEHKIVPTKMHHRPAHRAHSFSLRIPSNLSLNTSDAPPPGKLAPPAPLLVARAVAGDDTEAISPMTIIGICIAGGMCVVLAIVLLIRHQRKKARKDTTVHPGKRSIERGIENAKKASGLRRRESLDRSDETHVVDVVYGEKVRTSSFESSDYHALAHDGIKPIAHVTVKTNVVLPTPVARAQPKLKAIDVHRANGNAVPAAQEPSALVAPLPPVMFPSPPSSVNTLSGSTVTRTNSGPRAGLPQASALRALAVAAGVASTPTSPSFDIEMKEQDKTDMPIHFTPFRESTFGDGMKLGEHLGLVSERSRSQDVARESKPESPVRPSGPGSRPGTAGTFGQPAGPFSFTSRVPYRTHKHATSSLSISDVRSVRISYASGQSSPRGSFVQAHGRTESTSSNVVTRKVMTVFPPLLPDELVLAVGEKVTLLQSFDDEWCVVGRDRFGEVEVGAVPFYVFTKVRAGEKMQRPMRSTSLGVKVEMSNSPGAHFSSRDEVISWSNF